MSAPDEPAAAHIPAQHALEGQGIPTGISDLDLLTGGMLPGIWVIVGAHASGHSMWLTQLAGQAALASRQETLLISTRDDHRRLRNRLLSARAEVALHRLEFRPDRLPDEERTRLAVAAEELAAGELSIRVDSDPGLAAVLSVLADAAPPRMIVHNDLPVPDPTGFDDLSREIRESAKASGSTVVVGLDSRETLPGEGGPSTRVGPPWNRDADVVVRLYRPDQGNPDSPRAGEIDLHVVRNRRGPASVIEVAFQGHYARLVSLRPRSA